MVNVIVVKEGMVYENNLVETAEETVHNTVTLVVQSPLQKFLDFLTKKGYQYHKSGKDEITIHDYVMNSYDGIVGLSMYKQAIRV